MTDEQIKQTIALALGWSTLPKDQARMVQYFARNPDGKWDMVPNYSNDLNAMHEAEKVLTLSQFWDYADTLKQICTDRGLGIDEYITATARQRSEAFLKTLGKWEESS